MIFSLYIWIWWHGNRMKYFFFPNTHFGHVIQFECLNTETAVDRPCKNKQF